ncbi:MAG TPA: hypothetical protein ENI81_07580 [Phycisphaerales bacterium]|nr:hypothetical protein [Phycisphaerales bacterium]
MAQFASRSRKELLVLIIVTLLAALFSLAAKSIPTFALFLSLAAWYAYDMVVDVRLRADMNASGPTFDKIEIKENNPFAFFPAVLFTFLQIIMYLLLEKDGHSVFATIELCLGVVGFVYIASRAIYVNATVTLVCDGDRIIFKRLFGSDIELSLAEIKDVTYSGHNLTITLQSGKKQYLYPFSMRRVDRIALFGKLNSLHSNPCEMDLRKT